MRVDGLVEEVFTPAPARADRRAERRRSYRITVAGRAAAEAEARRLALLVDAAASLGVLNRKGKNLMDMSAEFPGPTPQLVVDDADRAIAFYRSAFGADELVRNLAPDGRVMHCELLMCGGRLLVVDDFEEDPTRSPVRLGGTTVRLHLYVPDVDAVYRRALEAARWR